MEECRIIISGDVDGGISAYDIDYPANLEFELVYKATATGIACLRVISPFSTGTNLTYSLQYARAGAYDSMGLSNGVAKVIASVDQDGYVDYVLPVPPGQTNLTITQSGGTGDADLYVAYGYFPWDDWDYFSEETGNNEEIVIPNPEAGEWFIESYGYDPSSDIALRPTFTPGAAAVRTASNTASTATFNLDHLTNGARVSIYSATNLLPSGQLDWTLRSNNPIVVNGKVSVNLRTNAPNELISVCQPLDF